jgi:transcriptional regulator with XRE-family HTH domain
MSPTSKIGKRLKKARKDLGLTQSEVGEKAGVNANYYSRIERDEVNPSLDVFENVLKVLKLKSKDVLKF